MSSRLSTVIGLTLLPWTMAYPVTYTAVPTFPALATVPFFPSPPTNASIPHLNDIERRFTPGNCGVHVRQYQKNEGPGGNTADYRFDVYLYDGAQAYLGGAGTVDIPGGSTADIGASGLPYLLLVTAGYVDADPVTFAYAGQHWSSNAAQCSVGKYDSGHRDMDCGFSC